MRAFRKHLKEAFRKSAECPWQKLNLTIKLFFRMQCSFTLCNNNCCHRLINCGTIHVHNRTERNHEIRNLIIDTQSFSAL